MLASGARKNTCIGHSDHVDDQLDLLSLIRSRKQRETCEELNHDTPKRPHVDLLSVREQSKHDIRSSVEPTLDISKSILIF